jgi:hypothetical protein
MTPQLILNSIGICCAISVFFYSVFLGRQFWTKAGKYARRAYMIGVVFYVADWGVICASGNLVGGIVLRTPNSPLLVPYLIVCSALYLLFGVYFCGLLRSIAKAATRHQASEPVHEA